ncbi:MAG: hypothetical protein IKY44_03590, partial [Clostridia bacterium]|nr:hypothetical protein [Clostridia bacterium]
SYADSAEQIADVLFEQSKTQIRLSVENVLESLGIDECEIEINTDITADNSIVISSIEVTVGENHRSSVAEIYAELQKCTDCKIAVYVGGNRDG